MREDATMKLVLHVTLVLVMISVLAVKSEPERGDRQSEAARQKIYDIISSHEDRKYGEHGGHEYDEGEIPRKSRSRKNKRYEYVPDQGEYYYVEQPKQPSVGYVSSRHPTDEKAYAVPNRSPVYAEPIERYPAVDTDYIEPKKGYLIDDTEYALPKRPESVYLVPKAPKEQLYRENVGDYAEDKTAPITIGKTARTVYPKPLSNTYYPVVDPKHPSEYVVLEGQDPPKPLILDPKLKATYQYSQPVAHYSAPEHQVIVKPKASAPIHYDVPVKHYDEHYGNHHDTHEKGHHASGHGYYDENALKKESGHKSHGHHDVGGHKAHSSVAAHHDEHGRHHNKGLYERDRGYHYEKAYAYDRVRAHHDVGSTGAAHSSYGAHQGHEAHKDTGNHGAETYRYFKKNDHGGGYGYHDGNSLYKKGLGYYDQKYIPTYYHG